MTQYINRGKVVLSQPEVKADSEAEVLLCSCKNVDQAIRTATLLNNLQSRIKRLVDGINKLTLDK